MAAIESVASKIEATLMTKFGMKTSYDNMNQTTFEKL
jgi:hypothetical protein